MGAADRYERLGRAWEYFQERTDAELEDYLKSWEAGKVL
jgi:hypothetical protein